MCAVSTDGAHMYGARCGAQRAATASAASPHALTLRAKVDATGYAREARGEGAETGPADPSRAPL
eukprot:694081-Prorocentrum_minimum.AAC.1